MRINTITCHDVYNHGASLQAFALQSYLSELGHDVQIIDYKPDYLSRHFCLSTLSNPRFDKPIIKWLYLLAKLPGRLKQLPRKKEFDEFTTKHLHLTPTRYNSYDELSAHSPVADAYIAGSDQIWNTRFRNGLDKAFYLSFAPKCANKISYAASFAHSDIQPEYRDFVKAQISGIKHISVREDSGVKILNDLGLNGVQVCDPVFLLSSDKWSSLCSNQFINQNYIVVYDFENSVGIKAVAERLAKEWNCKIYSVGPYKLNYADQNYNLAGPITFISAIKNARCVISNSFHASAFSMIFHTDFFVVKRNDGLNDRMQSLLSHYGISQRLIDENVESNALTAHIDFAPVDSILTSDTLRSKEFLIKSLNDK